MSKEPVYGLWNGHGWWPWASRIMTEADVFIFSTPHRGVAKAQLRSEKDSELGGWQIREFGPDGQPTEEDTEEATENE